jgi:hypothetical protein
VQFTNDCLRTTATPTPSSMQTQNTSRSKMLFLMLWGDRRMPQPYLKHLPPPCGRGLAWKRCCRRRVFKSLCQHVTKQCYLGPEREVEQAVWIHLRHFTTRKPPVWGADKLRRQSDEAAVDQGVSVLTKERSPANINFQPAPRYRHLAPSAPPPPRNPRSWTGEGSASVWHTAKV